MRITRTFPAVLAVALLGATPAAAWADGSGGAPTPSASGGTGYGTAVGRGPRPVATLFRLTPTAVRVGAAPPRVALRISRRGARTVSAQVTVHPTAGGRDTVLDLGAVRVGRTVTKALPPAVTAARGTYEVRLAVTDPDGQGLRRDATSDLRVSAAPTPAPTPTPTPAPSTGDFTFPLPHAAASGRSTWTLDQGVDIAAPGHTPLYAVGAGTVVGHGISGFGKDAPILRLDTPLSGNRYVYYGHAGPGNRLPTGTHVRAGGVLSEIGAGIVGISSGPHLEIGFCDEYGTPTPGTAKTMMSLLRGAY